jgi:hypothetical protein
MCHLADVRRLHGMVSRFPRLVLAALLAACATHVTPPPGHPPGLRYSPPSAAPWTPRGTLVVQVVSPYDDRPIAGADVYLSPSVEAATARGAAADTSRTYAIATDPAAGAGEFWLPRWPRGTYVLTAKRMGFGTVREWVRICGGRQDTVVVRLGSAGCDLNCQGVPRRARRDAACGRRMLD